MSSPHNPYLDPSSPNPNIIRIPTDIPLPKNILFILEAQRQKSDTPNILSWKEVVCAGSDDLGSSVEEERKIEEAGVGGSVREGDGRRPERSNKSPHGLSPDDAKRFFEILASTYK